MLLRVLALLVLAVPALADIPATPLMTVYQFNGPDGVPYYDVGGFRGDRLPPPVGTLAQGTSVVPCLVVRGGRPLTDGDGTPYVGFEVVVDARAATADDAARFKTAAAQRAASTVANHHCPAGTRHVVDARRLIAQSRAPSFDPPRPLDASDAAPNGRDQLDAIVRAFHDSPACAAVNARLMDRREALRLGWDAFTRANAERWPATALRQARQLDLVMRTALYEGHLGRGCSAYGACERNVIALSIRNRALERCLAGQGCRQAGDFEGVSSAVAQYNIWDEFLTQTTGLTACFLRPDLAGEAPYARLQAMYAQTVGDVERILFGGTAGLQAVFPDVPLAQLVRLRHYYHPPAMGKCFPDQPRLEYVSAAVARRGADFALIANTRVRVDDAVEGGYRFRVAEVEEVADRDVVRLADRYPGFVIDGRKIALRTPSGCTPYGISRACRFDAVGRHRKVPSWFDDGDPLRVVCRVQARDESCTASPRPESVAVGGRCDPAMQPVAGVR